MLLFYLNIIGFIYVGYYMRAKYVVCYSNPK